MGYKKLNMEVISSINTLNIIKKTLDNVDKRLIDHGERVGYIIYKLMEYEGGHTYKEMMDDFVVGLVHDIGAYKTEEIDDMVEFELTNVWEHSIYGYLFLCKLSPMQEKAESVLFHHLNYNEYKKFNVKNEHKAGMLKLADRIDVSLTKCNFNIENILQTKNRDTMFSAKMLDLFRDSNERYGIIENLQNGTYQQELEAITKNIHFTEKEKKDYLRMIAYSIDFRSEFMVLHTVTTVLISTTIGKHMGFSQNELTKLYFGSLLHDIGKVSTPVEILEKDGALTDEEMTIMKNHVVVSGEILGEYLNSDIYKIAVRHHEKIDGTGYPLGLSGIDLSLSEKIVAVADIMSALTRKRSYKEAYDYKKTIKILEEMRDYHKICPLVTNMVVNNYDLIMAEAEESSKEVMDIYQKIQKDYVNIRNDLCSK